jgi:hypothetical protein
MYFGARIRIDQFIRFLAMTGLLGACGGQGKSSSFEAVWVRSVQSAQASSEFNSVAADGSGNVYVAGDLWGPGSFDFGNGVAPIAASDDGDALLMKYDATGAAQWAQTIEAGSNRSSFSSVAVDSSGNVFASGCLYGASGPVDFGNGVTFTKSDTFSNAVLVSYDASGVAQWVQAVTGGSSDSCFSSVSVDPAGNVYVAGGLYGSGTYRFGDSVAVTGVAVADGLVNLPDNAVLAKYDASGAIQWARSVVSGSPASELDSVHRL